MAARANADNFEELVLKSELPVLVDFYSDSCIPCKMMAQLPSSTTGSSAGSASGGREGSPAISIPMGFAAAAA